MSSEESLTIIMLKAASDLKCAIKLTVEYVQEKHIYMRPLVHLDVMDKAVHHKMSYAGAYPWQGTDLKSIIVYCRANLQSCTAMLKHNRSQ